MVRCREDRCYLGEYLYIYVVGYNVVKLSLAIAFQVVSFCDLLIHNTRSMQNMDRRHRTFHTCSASNPS